MDIRQWNGQRRDTREGTADIAHRERVCPVPVYSERTVTHCERLPAQEEAEGAKRTREVPGKSAAMLRRELVATLATLRRRSSMDRWVASGRAHVGGVALGGAMHPSGVVSATVDTGQAAVTLGIAASEGLLGCHGVMCSPWAGLLGADGGEGFCSPGGLRGDGGGGAWAVGNDTQCAYCSGTTGSGAPGRLDVAALL